MREERRQLQRRSLSHLHLQLTLPLDYQVQTVETELGTESAGDWSQNRGCYLQFAMLKEEKRLEVDSES